MLLSATALHVINKSVGACGARTMTWSRRYPARGGEHQSHRQEAPPGAELGRLRKASGLTSAEAAERLMVSQSKISRMENGRRAISLRDVRDLCALYGVTDQQVIDLLMNWPGIPAAGMVACLRRHSGQRLRRPGIMRPPRSMPYQLLVIPGLLQTPAYAHAVIGEAVPPLTAEQAAARLKVRLRRQHRIYDPARPLRLWVVLDEAVLRRVVGSHDVTREQLEYLNAFGAEPHITVQVLPYAVGAHPGLSGQFSILQSTDGPQAGVVYLERFTSGIYLEKPSDVQHYSVLYDDLQAQASTPTAPAGSSPTPSSRTSVRRAVPEARAPRSDRPPLRRAGPRPRRGAARTRSLTAAQARPPAGCASRPTTGRRVPTSACEFRTDLELSISCSSQEIWPQAGRERDPRSGARSAGVLCAFVVRVRLGASGPYARQPSRYWLPLPVRTALAQPVLWTRVQEPVGEDGHASRCTESHQARPRPLAWLEEPTTRHPLRRRTSPRHRRVLHPTRAPQARNQAPAHWRHDPPDA